MCHAFALEVTWMVIYAEIENQNDHTGGATSFKLAWNLSVKPYQSKV